ncbi:hypothetical protein KY290_036393 [Solanum tuberosum]|uniref:Uncharacterized protein n=1 Tax=Solanum tuberosum TaxID=4113 RepID=A0ABQ7TUH7_SOLTU|nr:hypothetical protein KY289_035908 [Solanum tuberosum]KAH0639093.1 hypothetical protein KY285_035679 [Solanum tuberosum]KAH0737688.1 hypothetical protein KY290_036393 [Solanum tuberosum]
MAMLLLAQELRACWHEIWLSSSARACYFAGKRLFEENNGLEFSGDWFGAQVVAAVDWRLGMVV